MPSSSTPDESRVYRGAVIGAGGVARRAHLPAYRADAGLARRVEIVACVDPVAPPDSRDGAPLLRHIEELDRVGPIDFIDICTPTSSHLPLIEWGLSRGCHVLCEKPVALTRDEARHIARRAREAGRVVMPCHQYRFNPAWRQIREWLDGGAIGRWHLAEFHVYRPHADLGAAPGGRPWRADRAMSRGGVLIDHGTHLLYLLLEAGGAPRAVQSWTGTLKHADYGVEDTAHLLLDFGGGRMATLFVSWAGEKREDRMRFFGERGLIELAGPILSLETNGTVERRDLSAVVGKANYHLWFAELIRRFVAALDAGDGEEPLREIEGVAGLLEAAYGAASPRESEARHALS